MKSIIYLCLFLGILDSINCFSQKKQNQLSQIKKIKNCLVPILSERHKFSDSEIAKLIEKQKKNASQNAQNILSEDELSKRTDSVYGTAIFIERGGKEYLVTARHVLIDENLSVREYQVEKKREKESSGVFKSKDLIDYLKLNERLTLIPIYGSKNGDLNIQSVYSGDLKFKTFLDIDVIVVSLESEEGHRFSSILKSFDLAPLNINNIDSTGIGDVGSELIIAGFPVASRIDDRLPFMLPLFTFGRIAQFNLGLDHFIGDVTLMPGNSGGPAITDGKVIGIVTSQMQLPLVFDPSVTDAPSGYNSRSELAYIVKSNKIFTLLKQLQESGSGK